MAPDMVGRWDINDGQRVIIHLKAEDSSKGQKAAVWVDMALHSEASRKTTGQGRRSSSERQVVVNIILILYRETAGIDLRRHLVG